MNEDVQPVRDEPAPANRETPAAKGQVAARLRPWLELCRAPNLFTAMADPLAGALIVGATWKHATGVLVVMLASACLYAGGVILNDWYDYRKDLLERPGRPLPSGRIRRIYALLAAIGLLGGGVLVTQFLPRAETIEVAVLLLTAIVLYDIMLKEVPIAPVIMGACRALSLALGMTLIPAAESDVTLAPRIYLCVVLGLYVTGITVFARREMRPKDRAYLYVGFGICVATVLTVLAFKYFHSQAVDNYFGIVWLLVFCGVIGHYMSRALIRPEPATVKAAVKAAIFGIIILDAAFVAYARGLPASLMVVVLLVPALWLGRRLYST